jgi:hypothetical protein
MSTPFKFLPVGSAFEFDHSPVKYWSGAVGPWRKISARKYIRIFEPAFICSVGTVKTAVIAIQESNPPAA